MKCEKLNVIVFEINFVYCIPILKVKHWLDVQLRDMRYTTIGLAHKKHVSLFSKGKLNQINLDCNWYLQGFIRPDAEHSYS